MFLEYAKYPIWTLWRFLVDFKHALRNSRVVFDAFTRTVVIGTRAVRVVKKHRERWTDRSRGRYMWRVARRFWARWILDRCEIQVAVSGLEHVDWTRPHVVVCNHQSTLDILLLVAYLPWGRFVAKKEILAYPYVGSGCKYGGQILIDRGDHEQSMSAIRAGLRAWPESNVIFFAEGTRSRTGQLRPFKKGAFAIAKETGLPIVPVAISGTFDALPKGSLLRLRSRPLVRLEIGEAIAPDGTVPVLTERTRDVIAGMIKRSGEAARRVPAAVPSLQPGG